MSDPLVMRPSTEAETKAIERIAAKHPEAIQKLDEGIEAVVINSRVFIGQRRDDGTLTWNRAPARVSPTDEDFVALDELPVTKMIDLDSKTVGTVIGDKVMIGTYRIDEGERNLIWAQAARLQK